jgi:Amt family ammonium transporter
MTEKQISKLKPALAMIGFAILAVWAAWTPPAGPTNASVKLDTGDTAWMLTASALVLLMTPGLSFFYGGMVRGKNVLSTMLQSFIAMGVVSVLWVVVGFSLAFGDSVGGVIGNPFTFLMMRGVDGDPHPLLSPTFPLALFAIFQMKFAIITPALITGSFAERVRFSTYIWFIALFTIFIYCPLAHMTWHPDGLLRKFGVLDFAGGTVVHMSAGLAALAGAMVLGPRRDYRQGEQHRPAHIPFVLLGTGMLWFGWFGFNAGSAGAANTVAVHAFMTTNTASASAMIAWLLFDGMRGGKATAMGACIGAVVGLVAITPAAGYVSTGSSIFIGAFAAIVSNLAVHWKSRTAVDDTLDVFPCHGVGGIVGMLLTGVLADKTVNAGGENGLLHGNPTLFYHHVIALVAVAVGVLAGSWLIYKVLDMISPLRVPAEDEAAGLDLSQHGESILDADPVATAQ